jgi:hypothetical protein
MVASGKSTRLAKRRDAAVLGIYYEKNRRAALTAVSFERQLDDHLNLTAASSHWKTIARK